MRREIDRDITRVFQSNNQPRIVVNRAPECRVRVAINSGSIVRGIGLRKRSRDLRHAAGT